MIEVTKHGHREFAVVEDGKLLAVCVYRKGAMAVKERLETLQTSIRRLETTASSLREPLLWEECLGVSPRENAALDDD